MARLFGDLFDTDNTARRLQKEIESMEFKKQSLISTVQGEVQDARRRIDHEIYQIGLAVYQRHKSGGAGFDVDHRAQFMEIANHEALIGEKEVKMQEIVHRYDDEIGMLKSSLATLQVKQPQGAQVAPQGNAPVAWGSPTCPNCGQPYTAGEDMFCMSCGQSLATQTALSETELLEGASAFCGNCGKPYGSGDVFCMGCGARLVG